MYNLTLPFAVCPSYFFVMLAARNYQSGFWHCFVMLLVLNYQWGFCPLSTSSALYFSIFSTFFYSFNICLVVHSFVQSVSSLNYLTRFNLVTPSLCAAPLGTGGHFVSALFILVKCFIWPLSSQVLCSGSVYVLILGFPGHQPHTQHSMPCSTSVTFLLCCDL